MGSARRLTPLAPVVAVDQLSVTTSGARAYRRGWVINGITGDAFRRAKDAPFAACIRLAVRTEQS